MLRLLYVSSAARSITNEDLSAIVDKARSNNPQLGITGMLLYIDGNFLQVLEGPEPQVRELFRNIERDRRHKGVILLVQEAADERAFPDWSMGYKCMTKDEQDWQPVFALTQDSLEQRLPPDAPQEVLKLMGNFYRISSPNLAKH